MSRSPVSLSAFRADVDRHRIGVAGVVANQASEIAPATVVYGVVTTAVAATGLIAVPVAMLAVAVALAIFCVGYLAMARHIENSGAFYAYIARGIGKPVGVGAAFLALLSYLCFGNASYGGFGDAASGLLDDRLGVKVPWWIPAGVAVVAAAYLGVRTLRKIAWVLAVLVIAETIAVIVSTVATVLAPGFRFNWAAMSTHQLWGANGGKLFVIAVMAYVGYEVAAVYVRDSREPRRTVPRATYISLIAVAVLYWFASWVEISGAGAHVVDRAASDGPNLFGKLAAVTLGGWAVDANRLLFSTSLFAAVVAYQNVGARYLAVLGQEGVLPRLLGRFVNESPRYASLSLSLLSGVVVVICTVTRIDPLNQLFFWGGTGGAIGVMLLSTITSVAVIGFFARDHRGENLWRRVTAPALSTVILAVTSYLALTNLNTLYGPGSETISRATPVIVLVVLIAGTIWGLVLKAYRGEVYAGIGSGTDSTADSFGGDLFDTPRAAGARR